MAQTELTPEALRAIDKIQKLFALAGNNPNQEEAASAMEMAQLLLEQHNIEISAVERKEGSTGTKRADEKHSGGLYKWQANVWESTAKLNFCVYFRQKGLEKGSKYEHRVVGRPENVVMTKVMADYLEGAIERMARAWSKDMGYTSIFQKDVIIYREGMAATISERLVDLRRTREQEARQREEDARANGTGTEMTLWGAKQAEDDLNTDYLQGLEPGTTARKRAEREARSAAWEAEQEEKKRVHEARLLSDPVYAAETARKEAEAKARVDAYSAEWEKKWAKAEKRRQANGGGYYRRENEQDRRQSSHAYRAGRRDGHEIGLDPQVNSGGNTRGLK